MNTPIPILASRANSLLQGRFERYVSEIRTLLTKVERRGWGKETSAVRAELTRVSVETSVPESFSAFHDLARLQACLRRDVDILRSAASAGSRKRSAVFSPNLQRASCAPLSLNASTC